MKDETTFEEFRTNYQDFLTHIIKSFGKRFDTYDYLDFWAPMMINEEIRIQFRPSWLALVIMLIECPSNCYSEGLGRIGTLTRTSLRNRMSPLLQEFIMLVSESSSDGWTWEAHLLLCRYLEEVKNFLFYSLTEKIFHLDIFDFRG